MSRLVLFVAFVVGIVVVLNLKEFKSLPVNNSRFDFEKRKLSNEAKLHELQELKKARHAAMNKKTHAAAPVKTGPLVELTTEALKRGSALYKKCVVCHGKSGSGKKSQNAPAIGGQHDWYIESQVLNIQSGKRVNKVMIPYVKKLSGQDVKDLANYISKLPWKK